MKLIRAALIVAIVFVALRGCGKPIETDDRETTSANAVLIVAPSELDQQQGITLDQRAIYQGSEFREFLKRKNIEFLKIEPEQNRLPFVADHWQELRDIFDRNSVDVPGWVVGVGGRAKFGPLPKDVSDAIKLVEGAK